MHKGTVTSIVRLRDVFKELYFVNKDRWLKIGQQKD